MEPKSFDEMSEPEFEALLDNIGEGAFDDLTLPSFMDTLWALETARAQEVIEVTATVEADGLRLSGPEGVIVHGNEIIVNGKRIVVRLASVRTARKSKTSPNRNFVGCSITWPAKSLTA